MSQGPAHWINGNRAGAGQKNLARGFYPHQRLPRPRRQNDRKSLAAFDACKRVQDEHHTVMCGMDRFRTNAKYIVHGSEDSSGVHGFAQRYRRLEEALAGRWVVDLHVSRAWVIVLDKQRFNARQGRTLVDHVQVCQYTKAPVYVGVNAGWVESAAAAILGVDRRHNCIARHRKRTAVEPGMSSPNDWQPERSGHPALRGQDSGVWVQRVTNEGQNAQARTAGVQVDIEVGRAY
jgi:hypothetical protein